MSLRLWTALMALICGLAILMSLFIGATWISLGEVMAGLTGGASEPVNTIIQSIRFPRAILAALVGAGLGCLLYTSPSPRD